MIEQIQALWMRLRATVAAARITLTDDAAAAQLLQARISATELVNNLPRVAEYGFTSNPPPGSDAVVVFQAGDRSQGIVIATGNRQFRLVGLKSGEVAIHDNVGQSVYLSATGIVINGGANPVTVQGNLLVTGDIIDNSASNAVTVKALRTAYDAHDHVVSGITTGPSSVTSNPPTPTV